VYESVRRTGRLVVVSEAPSEVSVAAEVAAKVQQDCFYSLEAPVLRVTGFDTPYPRPSVRTTFCPTWIGAGWRRPLVGLVIAVRQVFKLPDVGEGLTEAEISPGRSRWATRSR